MENEKKTNYINWRIFRGVKNYVTQKIVEYGQSRFEKIIMLPRRLLSMARVGLRRASISPPLVPTSVAVCRAGCECSSHSLSRRETRHCTPSLEQRRRQAQWYFRSELNPFFIPLILGQSSAINFYEYVLNFKEIPPQGLGS